MVAIEFKGWLGGSQAPTDWDTTWLIYQNKKDDVRLQAVSNVTGFFVPPAARVMVTGFKIKIR